MHGTPSRKEGTRRMHDTRPDVERIAANEDFFRTLNEAITAAAQELHDDAADDVLYELMCECAVRNCSEMVQLTLEEYDRVRRYDGRFLVRPSHIVPQVEQVIEERDRYWVIEKFGRAREIVEELADS
jgi:hypothetical protein